MSVVIVNDASCLIDLRKGGLLGVLLNLPYRFVVPLPIRENELLDFASDDWQLLDGNGLETYDLPANRVADVIANKARHAGLSANDCICLVTAHCYEESILLTGDRLLRRTAESQGVNVHGVLWIVDELYAGDLCEQALLIDALTIWHEDASVRLPAPEIETRLHRLNS